MINMFRDLPYSFEFGINNLMKLLHHVNGCKRLLINHNHSLQICKLRYCVRRITHAARFYSERRRVSFLTNVAYCLAPTVRRILANGCNSPVPMARRKRASSRTLS